MKVKITHIILVMMVLMISSGASLNAQEAKNKKAKKGMTPVTIEIVDQAGSPVAFVAVSSSKNRRTYTTDTEGKVNGEFPVGDVLRLKAVGYQTKLIDLTSVENGKLSVKLDPMNKYEDEDHLIYTVDGGTLTQMRSVGAVSSVSGADLETYPSTYLPDALSGRLNGLFYQKTSTVPGENSWSGYVRAPHGGTPVVMIDGVVRSMEYIEPETIETVQLLKDASLKALFGGTHTNGILMITTKRGKPFENSFKINVQSGVGLPTAIPEYLNAREYAAAYNTALVNSGLNPTYNPESFDGSKPYQYPDVDYYDMFLKDYMTMTRANAQFSGGSLNTQYFLNLGFQNEKGMENFTSEPNRNMTLTVRGNVDNTILNFITLKVGINAALQMKKWMNTSASSLVSALSDIRPNEYPVQIPGSMLGSEEEFLLGGTMNRMSNPMGMLLNNGSVSREFAYLQTDFSILFDFNQWIQGLSISPSFTFDLYNYYSSRKDGGYSVYEPTQFDEQGNIITYQNWGYDNVVTSLVQGAVVGNSNWHFRTTANYDRTFADKHEFSAVLLYFMQQRNLDGQIHSVRRVNTAAMINYMYDKRFVFNVSANYVGVPSFAAKYRYGLFPTAGLGWVLSEEACMENSTWLDYLKLRGSYGLMGSSVYNSDGVVANYYYKDLYTIGSSYGQFTSFNNVVNPSQVGNPDLRFQKTHEINVGLDFELFRHSLSGSVGVFYNNMFGGIANSSDITPGVSGKGQSLKYENVKVFSARGVEAEILFSKRFGNFEFALGGNFTYGKSKVDKDLQPNYPDNLAGLRKTIYDGDVKGYHVIGTFKDQADIDNSPLQSFGGKIYPGDFKYEDVNKDGFVNDEDRQVICNNDAVLQYGINLSFKYKGINLDILGYGLAGFQTLTTSKYYQIYGGRKYSNVINTGLPNGNPIPTLRAENSNNNFVNSDYWVADGGFFKIRNVELGYTLPTRWTFKSRISGVKIFARGSNLYTLSQIKDLDPECLSAGLTTYPLMMSLTGGLSFSF